MSTWEPIGITSQSFTIPGDLVGQRVRVVVTDDTGTVASEPVGPIAAAPTTLVLEPVELVVTAADLIAPNTARSVQLIPANLVVSAATLVAVRQVLPSAPTNVTAASPSAGLVSVNATPGDSGGSPITSYTARLSLYAEPVNEGTAKSFNALYGATPAGKVTITEDVILDVNATVDSVEITGAGALIFSPGASRTLTSRGNVVVRGVLRMRPTSAAVVHLLKFDGFDENLMVGGGMQILASDVGLWVTDAGLLETNGTAKNPWARLTADPAAGATTITVDDATGWLVGDEISIAPSELPTVSNHWNHYDDRTITAISGNTITVNSALSWPHPSQMVNGVRRRSIVMNLNRNVKIHGTPTNRAHVMHLGHVQKVHSPSYVELRYLGPVKFNKKFLRPDNTIVQGGWAGVPATGRLDTRINEKELDTSTYISSPTDTQAMCHLRLNAVPGADKQKPIICRVWHRRKPGTTTAPTLRVDYVEENPPDSGTRLVRASFTATPGTDWAVREYQLTPTEATSIVTPGETEVRFDGMNVEIAKFEVQFTSAHEEGVFGRYGWHYHHNHHYVDTSKVVGFVARDIFNHTYVAHDSIGVTWEKCVAHDTFSEPFWWDIRNEEGGPEEPGSERITYDRCVASKTHPYPTKQYRLGSFHLNQGKDNAIFNCIATGNRGVRDSSGYHWPEDASQHLNNVWIFEGAEAFGNRACGLFIWQNDGNDHIVGGDTPAKGTFLWNNGIDGVDHGAYVNPYNFRHLYCVANGRTGFEQHASARINGRGLRASMRNSTLDCAGIATYAWRSTLHRLTGDPAGTPWLVEDVLFKGYTTAAIYVGDDPTFEATILDFVRPVFQTTAGAAAAEASWVRWAASTHSGSLVRLVRPPGYTGTIELRPPTWGGDKTGWVLDANWNCYRRTV